MFYFCSLSWFSVAILHILWNVLGPYHLVVHPHIFCISNVELIFSTTCIVLFVSEDVTRSEFIPTFIVVRVIQNLVFCVVFFLPFCCLSISVERYIVCPSSTFGFWLPLRYLQICLVGVCFVVTQIKHVL